MRPAGRTGGRLSPGAGGSARGQRSRGIGTGTGTGTGSGSVTRRGRRAGVFNFLLVARRAGGGATIGLGMADQTDNHTAAGAVDGSGDGTPMDWATGRSMAGGVRPRSRGTRCGTC